MYRIFSGNECLYDDIVQELEKKVISPVLTLEDSAPGSLEFELPLTNGAYNDIARYTDIVTVHRNGDPIWYGRIANDSRALNGTRKIYCEGALAILNDTMQPRVSSTKTMQMYLQDILDRHNAQVDSTRKFMIGDFPASTTPGFGITKRWTNYDRTISYFNQLHEELGMHIVVTYGTDPDYGTDPTHKCFLINVYDDAACYHYSGNRKSAFYQKNLIDISEDFDIETMATVVLPIGSAVSSGSQQDGDPEERFVMPATLPSGISDSGTYGGHAYRMLDADGNGFRKVYTLTGTPETTVIPKANRFEARIEVDTENLSTDAARITKMFNEAMIFLSEHRPENAQYTIQAVDGFYAGVDVSHVDMYDLMNITYPVLINGQVEMRFLNNVPVLGLTVQLDSPGSTIYTLNKAQGSSLTDVVSLRT